MPVIIAGHISFDETNHDALMDAAIEMMDETSKEPGCMEYVLGPDLRDRGRLSIFEKWSDAGDLGPHMESDHMSKWLRLAAELGVNGRDLSIYEISDESSL